MIKVGSIGSTGYTGVELAAPARPAPVALVLLNIADQLAIHPQVELKAITSRGEAGRRVAVLLFLPWTN